MVLSMLLLPFVSSRVTCYVGCCVGGCGMGGDTDGGMGGYACAIFTCCKRMWRKRFFSSFCLLRYVHEFNACANKEIRCG